MDDIKLMFNTNGKWMRSGNPGSAKDLISWGANVIPERIAYNAGYVDGADWYENPNWYYRTEGNEDIEFKETSAHEIGHEILKSYGTTSYSYKHKGSTTLFTQETLESTPNYPTSGEIDLMKYYQNWIPYDQRDRIVAAEEDVLGLLWLSKIRVEN